MLEKAIVGSKKYYMWLGFLALVIFIGFLAYLRQFQVGLAVTGLSRDVSWGFYIAQFTYLVGVAASAVMVVLPYYVHHYKPFGKITILGEFIAIGAVIMCMLFIFVDMGQPTRVTNVMLYPTLNSMMFWDMMSLGGYLCLNLLIGWTALACEKKGVPPPKWIKPFIYISIPWAVSIHTVTAFLYAGLPGRHLWLTAIMAARFLASAFCAGPSILILLALILRRFTSFQISKEPVMKVVDIITYAMLANVFFLFLEFFTSFYSAIPTHGHSLRYLFFGLHGHHRLVPFMWLSLILAAVSLVILLVPSMRNRKDILVVGLVALIGSTWLEKGLGLIIAGFIPNPLEHVTEYWPTVNEMMISFGVYAIGVFIISVLYKIVVSVREGIA